MGEVFESSPSRVSRLISGTSPSPLLPREEAKVSPDHSNVKKPSQGSAPGTPQAKPVAQDSPKGRAMLQQLRSTKVLPQGDPFRRPTASLSLQEKILLQRHVLAQAAAKSASKCGAGQVQEVATPTRGSPQQRPMSPMSRPSGGSAQFGAFGLELPVGKASPTNRRPAASVEVTPPGTTAFADESLQNGKTCSAPSSPAAAQLCSSRMAAAGKPNGQLAAKVSGPRPMPETAWAGENGSRPARLCEGVTVKIGDTRFRISGALGTGSYGVVWCAQRPDFESKAEYAVKEIICRTQNEMKNALFEGELLARLGEAFSEASLPALASRIPKIAAQEAEGLGSQAWRGSEGLGSQAWRVRLAMSRIPGEPLALVLHHCKRQKLRNMPAKDVLRLLAEPCRITSELLTQLGPALQELSRVAFHRDVNPRNIVVKDVDVKGRTSFGLVDFGMAVEARRWLGTSEKDGAWTCVEVGGDCRYWPLSSWLMFMRGPKELGPGSPLRAEYQSGLDLHALGISALQVLMEMSPLLPDEPTGPPEQCRILMAFRSLQDCWLRYWHDVSKFWQSLMTCFSQGGNWIALKALCIESGLDRLLSARLEELRMALTDIGSVVGPKMDGDELDVLVRTLLTLLSNASSQPKPQQPKPTLQIAAQQQPQQQPQQQQPPQHQPPPQQQARPQTQQVLNQQTQTATQQKPQQQQQQQQQHQLPQHQRPRLQSQPQVQMHQMQTHSQEANREHEEFTESDRLDRVSRMSSVAEQVRISQRTPRHSVTIPSSIANETAWSGTSSSAIRQRSGSPLMRRGLPSNFGDALHGASSRFVQAGPLAAPVNVAVHDAWMRTSYPAAAQPRQYVGGSWNFSPLPRSL
eukprot:CAMPEP_0181534054 /NCGR_PEP_ID=MMETSP1110-20121109/73495_1 /TAXON_ID=174948 /ORGANISM="Symbiodinium sp., Strain CCMP421" /LENGTH=859 /DNA_ID=CAMNT_0023665297 /DNA_START=63 /DNA_END=2642 /DNA_ORIENTATION=-